MPAERDPLVTTPSRSAPCCAPPEPSLAPRGWRKTPGQIHRSSNSYVSVPVHVLFPVDHRARGLGRGHHQDILNVYVRRSGNAEQDHICHILGSQRVEALIDLFGPCFVAMKTHL